MGNRTFTVTGMCAGLPKGRGMRLRAKSIRYQPADRLAKSRSFGRLVLDENGGWLGARLNPAFVSLRHATHDRSGFSVGREESLDRQFRDSNI
jgi:hypothetical protein